MDDTNVFLDLLKQDKDVLVPLLRQIDTNFSNFWTDLDENGYYKSSNLYHNIIRGNINNIINIPYFYGTVLIKKDIFNYITYSEIYNNNKWNIGDIDMALCNNFRNKNIQMIELIKKYGRIIKYDNAEKLGKRYPMMILIYI